MLDSFEENTRNKEYIGKFYYKLCQQLVNMMQKC